MLIEAEVLRLASRFSWRCVCSQIQWPVMAADNVRSNVLACRYHPVMLNLNFPGSVWYQLSDSPANSLSW